MPERQTIGPHISEFQTAQLYLEHVKGLRIAAPSKASKTVPDCQLSLGKRGYVVKLARDPKQLSTPEVVLLAKEYELHEAELTALLTKRKIAIFDSESGVITNAKPVKPARAKRAAKAKANAGDAP